MTNPAGAIPHFAENKNDHLPMVINNSNALATQDYRDYRSDPDSDGDEIDLRQLWQIIMRRKWLILSMTLIVLALAILATLMMTPIYRASTTIEIKPEETKVLEYDVNTQQQNFNSKDFYQTQYELLKSRKLADRVIAQLGLETELKGDKLAKPFFIEQLDSLKESFNILKSDNKQNENNIDQTTNDTETQIPSPNKSVLGERPLSQGFLSGLTVSPVKNSQIVTIHYDHKNPERAALISNAIAENFIEMNLERRRNAAEYAEKFLSRELETAKSKLFEAENKLNNYAKQKDIILTKDDNSLVAQRLEDLNKSLTEAEKDRVRAESDFQQAGQTEGASNTLKNATIQELKKNLAKLQGEYQAELSSSRSFDNPTIQTMKRQLADLQSRLSGAMSSSGAFDNPTVQGLKRELATLEAEYREKAQIYKPAYPLMVQIKQKIDSIRSEISQETKALNTSNQGNLRQQINELQTQIARETQALNANTSANLKQQIAELQAQIARETNTISNTTAADLRAKYLAAKQREDTLRAQVQAQKTEFENLRDKTVGYGELRREVESNRNIYEGLLNRQKQVGVAAGVGSNNISIVDEATIPFSVYKPNKKLNAALGLVGGLFLGLVLAFLLEFLDDRIKSPDDVERLLSLPILGIIPRSKNKDTKKLAIMTQSDPRSAFAEAFRSLRTNLMFSTRTGVPRTLAITSASAAEGKTTTAINLATVFAQSGKTILLVDTDLRNPSVHKRLGLDNSKGLTNYLTGQDHAENVTQSCQIPDVYVITAGPLSPNPVELLSGERLDELLTLANQGSFDMVILDMPPVLGLADALIVSNRVDATILSVIMGESKKQILSGAFKRLRQARSNIIGVVLSKAKQGSGYGYHYDYNYYTYGHDNKLPKAV
ncbi:polysaccharide biosynthesis tyrosine autokinase [Thiolinea disciformis]|uniref:polysaccharide biosynthesis tyrosine autokinase n=1 Tax=Thiolinea disciformis TaxID=125614 RepID=UPI00038063EB|nr:polysaccharide biosynthesis tyrosine autokinase [Thiolinea disciformis]